MTISISLLLAVLILATGLEVDEGRGAEDAGTSLYADALVLCNNGEIKAALEKLEESFRAGYTTPCDVLQETGFEPLRKDPESRIELRNLLRDHASESEVFVVPASEPGEHLVVRGQILQANGDTPASGVQVYFFQTAANGRYSPEERQSAGGNRNPRIFGFVRPDQEGKFIIHTVVPGSYPGGSISRHIHYLVTGAGYKRAGGEILFDEEPAPGANQKRWAKEHGFPVVKRVVGKDNNWRIEVVLRSGTLVVDSSAG